MKRSINKGQPGYPEASCLSITYDPIINVNYEVRMKIM